jgi:hypothetical protein
MKIPIVALGTRGDVQPINEPRRTDREDFGEPRVALDRRLRAGK